MGKSSKVNIAVMLLATFAKNKLMPETRSLSRPIRRANLQL